MNHYERALIALRGMKLNPDLYTDEAFEALGGLEGVQAWILFFEKQLTIHQSQDCSGDSQWTGHTDGDLDYP